MRWGVDRPLVPWSERQSMQRAARGPTPEATPPPLLDDLRLKNLDVNVFERLTVGGNRVYFEVTQGTPSSDGTGVKKPVFSCTVERMEELLAKARAIIAE